MSNVPGKQFLICLLIGTLSSVLCFDFLKENFYHAFPYDDSYITCTIANSGQTPDNNVRTGNFTLSGATSPLHIFILRAVSKALGYAGINKSIETAALIVGISFHALSCMLFFLLAWEIFHSTAIACVAGIALATQGMFLFDALNGLETTQYIFFSIASLYCFIRWKKALFYSIGCVLSILTRPEGWFLFVALCAVQLWNYVKHGDKQELQRMFSSMGIVFAIYGMVAVALWNLTGLQRHNTALAKLLFFNEVSLPLQTKIKFLSAGTLQFLKQLAPYLYAVVPLCFFARKVSTYPFLVLYSGCFYLFYLLLFPGATGHYGCRYQHIFIPILIVLISAGIYQIFCSIPRRIVRYALMMLFAAVLIHNQFLAYQSQKAFYRGATVLTKLVNIDLAYWIRENTPSEAVIAAHDIGVMGYFSQRTILDLVGLINPEMRDCYWDSKTYWPRPLGERDVMEYLKIKRPDYLVVVSDWDRYFNFKRSAHKNVLRLIYQSKPIVYYGTKYLVYQCTWQ